MAVAVQVELESGIVLENCYVKVHSVEGSKGICSATLAYYASEQLYRAGKSPVKIKGDIHFQPDVGENSSNFIKQTYEHIKTTPEFEDAVDILEEG